MQTLVEVSLVVLPIGNLDSENWEQKNITRHREGALFASKEALLFLALGTTRKKLQPARKQFQPAGKNSGGATQDAHCAS